MEFSRQNRCVRIKVPLEGGRYNYFSGYILADGYVLSCLHGFSKTNGRKLKPEGTITIRSHNVMGSIKFKGCDYQSLVAEGILLFVSDDHDIAILACPVEGNTDTADLYAPEILAGSLIREGDQWECGGYPFFRRNEQATVGFEKASGVVRVIKQGATNLELTIHDPPLVHKKDWKEISGAPVFIRGKLAGIVHALDEYKDDRNKRVAIGMLAVSLEKAHENSQDLRKLYAAIVEKQNYPRKRLLAYLNSSAGVALVDNLKEHSSELLPADAGYEAVCDYLCSLDKLKLAELFVAAKNSNAELRKNVLLAAISSRYVNALKEITELVYKDAPTAHEYVCELLMSAQDKRDPLLYSQKNRLIPGRYSLITPPETGIKGNAAESIISDLAAGRADVKQVAKRIYADLEGKPDESFWSDSDEDDFIEGSARYMLEEYADDGTYYLTFDPRRMDEGLLQKIHDALPQIEILKLDRKNFAANVEESKLSEKLRHFIKE